MLGVGREHPCGWFGRKRPPPHKYLTPLDSSGVDGHPPDLFASVESLEVARVREAMKLMLFDGFFSLLGQLSDLKVVRTNLSLRYV